jgi:nucleotide-binding universal stress UspA family protein
MTAAAREHAVSARAEFDEAVRRAGLAAAWREDDGDSLECLAIHARYADLVVVSRASGVGLEDEITGHRLDHIALHAPCPALIVPAEGSRELRCALVAWKSCREAARALRDALPFLRGAEKTTLLTIAPTDSGHLPGAEAAAYLARHGVRVEVRADYGDDRDAGDVIERHARDLDADLVVMGAYGRSRLRELVLGGATRHLLTQARVPILMSH